jgi:hypothetical protein
MDLDENSSQFNMIDLIREIRSTPADLSPSSAKQCFPYLQTFYTPKEKEKAVFSYSNRLGINFTHNDTLKFSKPFFSVGRMFKSIESPTRIATPAYKRSSSKPFSAKKTFLTSFQRIGLPQNKETSFKNFFIQKIQPRLRKPSNKSTRLKRIVLENSERLSPDILKINKIFHVTQNSKNDERCLSRIEMNKNKQKKIVIELDGVLRLDESETSFNKSGSLPRY